MTIWCFIRDGKDIISVYSCCDIEILFSYFLEEILAKFKMFQPSDSRICLQEKYYIMYNHEDATLNQRQELNKPFKQMAAHFEKYTRDFYMLSNYETMITLRFGTQH